jgi:hypothetical protein
MKLTKNTQEHTNMFEYWPFTTRIKLKGNFDMELTWTKVSTYIACQYHTRSFEHGVVWWWSLHRQDFS